MKRHITWREALEHERETYQKLQAEIDKSFGAGNETPLAGYVRESARQIEDCGLAIAALKGRERDRAAELELHEQRALLNGLVAGLLAAIDAAE